MTDGQKKRLMVLMERDGVHAVSAWVIPEGSVMVSVRREGQTWLEVLEPEPTFMLAWDLG
jgi:hypothetical protein